MVEVENSALKLIQSKENVSQTVPGHYTIAYYTSIISRSLIF